MDSRNEAIRRRFEHELLVLDGATGTELERRGVATPAPLWSAAALIDAPQMLLQIHRDDVDAGADILTANTFRTNPRTLRAAGRFSDGPSLCALAIDLARRAAGGGRGVLVAASVAPVEDCYAPERVPSLAELEDEHALLAAWLARAGPDLLWVETIGTVREALAAARAARTAARLPFLVSFILREDGNLLGGETLRDAVAAVSAFQPLAIGVNCVPPPGMAPLLRRLRALTPLPLVAYGHIGNARPIRGWSFASDESPDVYAACAATWLGYGVRIVGGCCGTGPAHTAALRRLVDARIAAGGATLNPAGV